MTTTDILPALELSQGRPVCTSPKVAEHFGKRHTHVLDSIQKITADLPPDFNEPNFRPVEYLDAKGEKRPAYHLTRDGFTLLAFGFTGKRALAWKLKYIQAFNAMEAEILKLRGGGAVPPDLAGRLERLERQFEIAVVRDYEAMRRAALRAQARQVLGQTAYDSVIAMVAHLEPQADAKRDDMECFFLTTQVRSALGLDRRPRRRKRKAH